MIHNVHPTHLQRLNQGHGSLPPTASHRHMAHPPPAHQQGPPPPPPHLNAQMTYVSNQQMQQAQVAIPPHQTQQQSQASLQQQQQQQSHLMHKSQNYHQNRSNQHYHQHHQQQRTNSGSGNTGGGGGGIQHSMHTNRQTYHNGQMAPGGGKGPYQYHTNASAMNGNGRVAILHKPTQMEPPSHPHPIENIENVEPVIVTSEEKHFDEMVINRPPECANITTAKNKTAMCLINELVRSNKLSHQYRVINEKGQPHQKEFTVCLELGDEKYTASGTTIKMAQQAAAAEALSKTKHQRPAGRQTRSTFSRKNTGDKPASANTITPTVELNSMAMKRGIIVSYTVQYPKSYHEFAAKVQMTNFGNKYRIQNNNINNNNNNMVRASGLERHRTTEDDPYRVTVQLGNEREFNGIGLTLQAAKHDAAAKAITHMKAESMNSMSSEESENSRVNDSTETSDEAERIKSAISIVQEVAQKRDLLIRFAVKSENGPAHMKHFVITCSVGDITTSGEGNSKKIAKKHAAEAMVDELQKLPPLPSQQSPPPQNGRRAGRVLKRSIPNQQSIVQPVAVRRKPKNLIKEVVSSDEATPPSISASIPATTAVVVEDEVINPISRLLRMQQAAKKREPVYSVIEERGQQKRKEFVVEVECNGEKAQGVGSNKKLAKRMAAENYLVKMGYPKMEATDVDGGKVSASGKPQRRVIFKEPEMGAVSTAAAGGSAGRQLVPGVLLMKTPDNSAFKAPAANEGKNVNVVRESFEVSKPLTTETTKQSPPAIEAQNSSSEPVEGTATSTSSQPSVSGGIRPVNQLLYLAKLLKFEVHFSDFPKGNHSDYLTLASLTTDPPQMFHGSGNSLDASKDQAALSALKTISELGLDNIRTPKAQDQQPSTTTNSILTNGQSSN